MTDIQGIKPKFNRNGSYKYRAERIKEVKVPSVEISPGTWISSFHWTFYVGKYQYAVIERYSQWGSKETHPRTTTVYRKKTTELIELPFKRAVEILWSFGLGDPSYRTILNK